MSALEEARKLIERINPPNDLRPNWEGTNHYELTSPKTEEYFWLIVINAISQPGFISTTTEGKRLGYCLEAAALLPRVLEELSELGLSKNVS